MAAAGSPPFRVRYAGGDFMPIDLAPSMTEGGIKEAVAALLGLAVGTFGIKSVDGARGSGFHAGLKGDWDVVLLPVATTGAGAWGHVFMASIPCAACMLRVGQRGALPSSFAMDIPPPPLLPSLSCL